MMEIGEYIGRQAGMMEGRHRGMMVNDRQRGIMENGRQA
jgi:hypothetical protein